MKNLNPMRVLSVGRWLIIALMVLPAAAGIFGAVRSYNERGDLLFLFALVSIASVLTISGAILYAKFAFAHKMMPTADKSTISPFSSEGKNNTLLSALADSKLVSEVAHDLKTPLTVMGGYAKLTMRQIETDNLNDQSYENLHTIFTETQRLSELVDKLLDPISHKPTTNGELRTNVVDLMHKVYTMCSLLLEFNSNQLEIDAAETYPPICVNADMVIQVFFNLVGNANRHVKSATVKIKVTNQDDMVAFSVWNNGPIIPPDMINKIFYRGISGAGSTGLGLHICKENIERFGGKINVVSNAAEGTKFTFTLPAYKE